MKLFWKEKKFHLLMICFFAILLTYFTERFCYNSEIIINIFYRNITIAEGVHSLNWTAGIFLSKQLCIECIFIILYLFLGLHFVISPKKIYSFLFKYRYLIAFFVFIFLVLNQYHGSSIARFDKVIQSEYSSEFSEPVLGWTRAIRSDEWLVSTPNILSASYGDDAFGRYNMITRATETPNVAIGKMFCSYAALASPFNFGYFIFGMEYGQSINWFGTLILMFLISIEFLLILCNKNKTISVAGAGLIVFSGFNLWWSQVQWILWAQACIVCGYHFIIKEKRWQKILLAIGLGLSIAAFVCLFYPAWQVPVGYLFLGILVWILIDQWEQIKKIKVIDWIIFICAFVFAISIILSVLYYNQEYTEAISQTVYPGNRVSLGGLETITLQKMFAVILTPLSIINRVSNSSEYSSFLTFFPIPFIFALIYVIKKKKIKDNLLLIILTLYSFIIGTFLFIGWPGWLSKYSLMSYSPVFRCIDIFNYAQLLLLLVLLSKWEKADKLNIIWSGILVLAFIGFEYLFTKRLYATEGISDTYYLLAAVILGVLLFFLIVKIPEDRKWLKDYSKKTVIIMSIGCVMLGLLVHPLQKGFDVIFSKPLAKEIKNIISIDPDSRWADISCGLISQQYLIACGAPTINSTNTMPNVELWEKIDTKHQYSHIYNRYAHVAIQMTDNESSFELIQEDAFLLNLAYSDLDKIGIKYLFYNGNSSSEIENYLQHFDLVYQDQCSIFKVR